MGRHLWWQDRKSAFRYGVEYRISKVISEHLSPWYIQNSPERNMSVASTYSQTVSRNRLVHSTTERRRLYSRLLAFTGRLLPTVL